MRISNYMITASAAALLLTGSAFAQSPNMDKGGSAATPMQKSEPAAPPAAGAAINKGPAEKTGPALKGAEGAKAPDGAKAAEGAKAPETNKMSQDNKAPVAPSKSAAETAKPGAASSTTASDTKSGAAPANRTATDSKAGDSKNAETTTRSSTTVGSTGDSVSLTTQQKTTLREKVLVSGAPRVDHVDFAINVGTRVPSSVRVVEVPETLIVIHPQWKGYRYFVVNDQIIVVDPRTLEIVAVLDV